MNLHQIVSGACNAGDKCFAVGSVEGVPFTAYAAGCNIVILASTFERVQIIPGAVHDYIRISSVDCSCDTGKIAAAYDTTVCIYEPTPLINSNLSHGLDYCWVQTGTLKTESPVRALSWNLEGTRLLTAGALVQLWHLNSQPIEVVEQHVRFTLGGGETQSDGAEEQVRQPEASWACVWRAATATPVQHLAFSPDGTLFATCGENDRLVKIWYENKHILFTKHTESASELEYGFVYIAHPRAVTHLSWRTTSKYMPKGAVSNMLVTSCKDNICRLWVETVLPEDGLVNLSQLDPQAHHPKYRTHRHKHRFMQRLKHMKTCFHIRRHAKHSGGQGALGPSPPIPTLPSTYSVHDFHSYGYHGTGVTPGLHFHLAASVNAETDIPLVPRISFCNPRPAFVLHWLDNKEMHFTMQAESLVEELTRRIYENPDSEFPNDEPLLESGSNDGLDARIEALLRDWHHSPDLLFSIHPVDGSYLIWVVEWLDEYHPGSFRQAQVSFSTRIPSAFPLGDSLSMSTTVSLYSTAHCIKHVVKDALKEYSGLSIVKEEDETSVKEEEVPKPEEDTKETSPVVYLVTKHDNGTLNLWQLTFADKSKYTQVLSIGHNSRASGHRFRVNDITCHPVLPLLLTTSHHNIVEQKSKSKSNLGFCSELILWKVDAVGPLSKSGGICELARISSPEPSAFSNVAWIPTLLPSSTLGNLSNSPSACFVASDGQCLRVYQAVIDARTLLADISFKETRKNNFDDSISSDLSSLNEESLLEKINIVSQQSTSRPGCIIQLETISPAIEWQNTTFLHVYQEQLITGQRATRDISASDAMVDLQQNIAFEQPFYIVLLDCTDQNTIIHMWKLTIASSEQDLSLTGSQMYVPDCNLVQDENELSRRNSLESLHLKQAKVSPHISITTKREIKQVLPLPDGVEVIHAAAAAGHLSSASIYPACLAPYCFATACSDSTIRFWTVSTNTGLVKDMRQYMLEENGDVVNTGKAWAEWNMVKESAIDVDGQVLNISVAYSGRLACAYKYGRSFTRPNKDQDQDSRYINLCVAIYECESTGGTEWILEDVIHLKNIHLPRISLDKHLDLRYLYDQKTLQKKQRINEVLHTFSNDERQNLATEPNIKSTLLAVPSFSTLQSLRKSITERGNICPLTQKHIVQLDWVSNEDGSHILTVACGSKIMLYTPLSSDLAQANVKAMKESLTSNRPILRKASSLAQPMFVDDFKWMTLRKIELQTADGLPPLPMQISWVRDGILVVGMDSEMHVYSQWKPQNNNQQISTTEVDSKNARDVDFRTLTQENQRKLAAIPTLGRISSVNLQLLDRKRANKDINIDYMPDYGLFEASRIACPVLPQYHPKQLMELLNSGKIRWVKAILSHLVLCIGGNDSVEDVQGWARTRTLSVSYPAGSPEHRASIGEIMLDYKEIDSIPPVPLWTLLAADKEKPLTQEEKKDYNELFDTNLTMDESLDSLLEDQDNVRLERRPSERIVGVAHFTPRQGRVLSRLLTHTHLPGLSSLDQMHLLALADTVSTCNTDLAERFAIDAAKSAMAKENVVGQPEDVITDSLDDCGLRFLLAMKHYNYLLRCLPLVQRAQFQKQGVGTNNLAWAYHSESQEELLNLIPSYAKGEPTWQILRELGVGWWIRNMGLLRQAVQVLAKAAYQSKQDPMDAALYYLAMNKKSLLWGLYRSKKDDKMTQFFANNFSEDRWRKAALKNAYALLGKQRFDHAAGFFLLAGSLKDAVEVCLYKLQDIQLAIIIIRLYEGDGASLKKLLYQEILGCDPEGNNQDMTKAHPDPFLRSMALWTLKEHQSALSSLLVGNAGSQHPAREDEECRESKETDPNVFNFYVYLRTHPLLVMQNKAKSGSRKVWLPGGKQVVVEESITPLERQLYFMTAHGHFRAGCPALALEVLSKLPYVVTDYSKQTPVTTPKETIKVEAEISTGIMSWDSKPQLSESTGDFDWGSPSTDLTTRTDDLVLDWTVEKDDDEDSDDSDVGLSMNIGKKTEDNDEAEIEEEEDAVDNQGEQEEQIDIMAQQLKFVACLKILMEELSTLATGFEVDGGQLRYQLYIWLEKEVEALRELCNYAPTDTSESTELDATAETDPVEAVKEKPTLHDILIQEKLDFEAKVQRAGKRRMWLKANETLLRTLLSYCSLHGATGCLASVRMELVLLLQELQQEKTHQQLLSPLPFPTSLPLLAASVASSKTVVADPIRYLQSLTHDMLQTMVELPQPSTGQSQLLVLRDLAIALSACIYQSLCDSDTFKSNLQDTQEYCSTHLVGRRRRMSTNEAHHITTLPSKWPGVTSLRALLAQEKDDDTPRLTVLLCESFIATFLSLLLYGLVTCDCVILFYVTAHNLDTNTWGSLFGGSVKKLLRNASVTTPTQSQGSATPTSEEASGATNWLNKQRSKLNAKLLGHQQSVMKEDKPTYREQFVAPEMSMMAFLLTKPDVGGDYEVESDEEEEEDDEEVFSSPAPMANNNEHSDPSSYSWLVLRLATLKMAHCKITEFLAVAGIEMSELPVASPLIHSILRRLNKWQDNLRKEFDCRHAPPEYIPGCFVENIPGPLIHKYRQLLEPHNTPFCTKSAASAARLLWTFLVHQEVVRDIFIRAVFGKRRSMSALDEVLPHPEPTPEPVRIIHKEQDSIAAFSINQVNSGQIVIATPRELQEMDISLLLELPVWLEDECELDILNISRQEPDGYIPPFLVISSAGDKGKNTPGSPQPQQASQSGRGTTVTLKHKIDGVRRITSHPTMPLYLTGGQDGSVQLWEWGHSTAVAIPREPGTYAKVTRLRFSQQGNKFGVADSDGNLSLFQCGLKANSTRPFFTHQCHNKGISDFVFLNSCSLLATAGHSSESKNVCIWDTILPRGKCLTVALTCHEQGASSMVYAPQHQILITAGKKGDVCLIDTRTKTIHHRFQAHENAVKCLAIDPHEEFFATGSADGDIKIWGVSVPTCLMSFTAEHAKSTFFKNIGPGVTQLHIDSHSRLFSCGADGSMKVRQLPDRETFTNNHH